MLYECLRATEPCSKGMVERVVSVDYQCHVNDISKRTNFDDGDVSGMCAIGPAVSPKINALSAQNSQIYCTERTLKFLTVKENIDLE